MAIGEILSFAYDAFCSNKIRFILTALGMVICGTASLILVVTIGMTGKQYVLNQIQAIGTNEVWAEYLGGAPHISNSNPDPLTIEDLHAIQQVSARHCRLVAGNSAFRPRSSGQRQRKGRFHSWRRS